MRVLSYLALFTLLIRPPAPQAAPGYLPLQQAEPPNVTDLVLIYQGGTQRLAWTPDQFAPYVSYSSEKGSEQWLFDGFLFIEFSDGKGHAYGEGGKLKPAGKEQWLWLLDRNFEPDHAIPALEKAVAETAKRIGNPLRPREVVLTLPEPYYAQTNWGALNGRALNFSSQSDRLAAAEWYMQLALERWNKLRPKHLHLAGFYWVTESSHQKNVELLPDIARLIHSRGKQFFWIPYWSAANAGRWRELGFDAAYQQPNHFFHPEVPDTRLDQSCAFAKQNNMGLEFEMDGRVITQSKSFAPRFEAYLSAFNRNHVQSNSAVAYYEGGGALLSLARSSRNEERTLYDRLAKWVAARQELADQQSRAKKVK